MKLRSLAKYRTYRPSVIEALKYTNIEYNLGVKIIVQGETDCA